MPTDPEIVEEDEPCPLTDSDLVEDEIEPYVTPPETDDPDIREDRHHPTPYFMPLEHFPDPSIEELFGDVRVGSWTEQLTLRAFVVSFMLILLFTFVAINVNLTIGLVPTLTVPVALLAFCMVENWMFLLSKFGFQSRPFSRQENTIIQTCFSTAYEIAFCGGLGTYLLAMTRPVAEQAGEGESAEVIELYPRWIVPFLFCVSYAGTFMVVIFRKVKI